MPSVVNWSDMTGRETKVTAGPYNGLRAVVQGYDAHTKSVTLGYLDRSGQPRTITVEASQVEMPLREGEAVR